MNQLLSRIKEIFPHFNERAITEVEFWRAAKKEKVIVRSVPLMVDGYYQRYHGRHYILINEKLNGLTWLFTALHEFCHYLFHEPCDIDNYVLYRRGARVPDGRERQADAFAMIALFPINELKEVELACSFPDEWMISVINDRKQIFDQFGL